MKYVTDIDVTWHDTSLKTSYRSMILNMDSFAITDLYELQSQKKKN